MSDVHRWLRSRAAQLTGLGVAAALIAAALVLAAHSRRDAAVATMQAGGQATLAAGAQAIEGALPGGGAAVVRSGAALPPADGLSIARGDPGTPPPPLGRGPPGAAR